MHHRRGPTTRVFEEGPPDAGLPWIHLTPARGPASSRSFPSELLPRSPLLAVLRRVLASLEPDLRLCPDLLHLPATPGANAAACRGVPDLPGIRLPPARPAIQPECRPLP